MQPQQPTGVAALLAKMYGATDPDTGIPLDVAWGLRDPGIETRDVDQTAYLRKLVDSTLSGERYG
jgi:hypothetical protein